VRKAARIDKEDWLQEQCQEIKKYAESNRSRKAHKLINQINRSRHHPIKMNYTIFFYEGIKTAVEKAKGSQKPMN